MRFKLVLSIVALILSSLFVFGCGGGTQQKAADVGTAGDTTSQADDKGAVDVPTRDNPMVVDKENGIVKVYAEVNAKYFVEPTRHGVIMEGGVFGDKPLLTAFTKPADFYQALLDIGGKPGDNVEIDSPADTIVQGDLLKVTVDVDGEAYDFSEIFKGEPAKGWEPRFGGNLENAKVKNTGCILCLDSCSVGITSNAKYGYKEFNDGKAKFYGVQEILKEDKKPVVVSFELAE